MKFDRIRIWGLQESDTESVWEKNEEDMSEVKAMLSFLKIDCEFTELRRIGQQQVNRKRTLEFKVAKKGIEIFSCSLSRNYKITVNSSL